MMKKAAIVSKHKEDVSEIKALLKKLGLKHSKIKPDFVLSIGGDGTLLIAEHKYPGVPKIALRKSPTCIKCENTPAERVIKKIINEEFYLEEQLKLEILVKQKKRTVKMVCLNDFIMRNSNISRAIRFSIKVNEKTVHRLIIGDGLVVSTPFGSTAYFKNITRSSFKKGLGIALNNTNVEDKVIRLKEDDVIRIELLRGPADISADHQVHPRVLKEKAEIIIKKSSETAKLIRLK